MSYFNEYNYSELKKEFKEELPSIKRRFAKEKEMVCISVFPLSNLDKDFFSAFSPKGEELKVTPKSFETACKKLYKVCIKDLRDSNETTKKIKHISIHKDPDEYGGDVYLYGYAHETQDEFNYRMLLDLKQSKDQKEEEDYIQRKMELDHKLKIQDLIGSIKRLSDVDKEYVLDQIGDKT